MPDDSLFTVRFEERKKENTQRLMVKSRLFDYFVLPGSVVSLSLSSCLVVAVNAVSQSVDLTRLFKYEETRFVVVL
jgi:hypothetical protein